MISVDQFHWMWKGTGIRS